MLPFEIVDVFTDRAFAGNQLAVVYDGAELSTRQMQAVANEFGFSETSFVLPPTTGEADYRARIFTPAEELPFAGHPTIGSAVAAVASERVRPDGGTVVQECEAGLMTIGLDGATAKLTSTAIAVGEPVPVAVAARACGLDPSRVVGTPQTTSAGLPHNFVHLEDADVTAATSHLGELELVYPFSFDRETRAVHGRLFHNSVGEDPATGSAAMALGVYLVEHGLIRGEGAHAYEIGQGAEMGRPSKLSGEVVVERGKAVAASVTGSVAHVARGELLTLPSER
ncbi:PhzF family phenazine biosynthesis protein [Glycomyces xiaoerkulensis]|uniref:PhzF family phenazine biosynthesis protein n=1 Tax=Glycomyces xiaoerkulensis TaxID=2038139 RepID=UPI000C261AA5|nr:PhzF family phenazine biosynthesis protein [Glycomyces xiaoerkulensis]